jgi:hypothetical protein
LATAAYANGTDELNLLKDPVLLAGRSECDDVLRRRHRGAPCVLEGEVHSYGRGAVDDVCALVREAPVRSWRHTQLGEGGVAADGLNSLFEPGYGDVPKPKQLLDSHLQFVVGSCTNQYA